MNRTRRLLSLCLVCLGIAAAAPAAQAAAGGITEDLRMVADSAPFRRAADEFIARSMAGDAAGTLALLSRRLVERSGDAAIRQALQGQILPFFQRGRAVGRSVTVTQTTDAAGQQGFAFYMWLQSAEEPALRPFTVYVVKEQDRVVVANVVPDRLVEGRHR